MKILTHLTRQVCAQRQPNQGLGSGGEVLQPSCAGLLPEAVTVDETCIKLNEKGLQELQIPLTAFGGRSESGASERPSYILRTTLVSKPLIGFLSRVLFWPPAPPPCAAISVNCSASHSLQSVTPSKRMWQRDFNVPAPIRPQDILMDMRCCLRYLGSRSLVVICNMYMNLDVCGYQPTSILSNN